MEPLRRRSAPYWAPFNLLGRIAIGDPLTELIGAASLAVLFRWKVSNPLWLAITAVIGLIAYPILQPAWVIVDRGRALRSPINVPIVLDVSAIVDSIGVR